MNIGSLLQQLGQGLQHYESGRDGNVWRALEQALQEQSQADMDLEAALTRPQPLALTHEQAFSAGITAAVAALLGAQPESIQRSIGSYVVGQTEKRDEARQRELQGLQLRRATARDVVDTELGRAKMASNALEEARNRTAALIRDQQRSRDANTKSQRDRDAKLTGIRMQSESKHKSDLTKMQSQMEIQKLKSKDSQLRELADLFLGVLAAQSRNPGFSGLANQAEDLMRELLMRMGVNREVPPLQVVPIFGKIGK